ncbi:MAG: carbon-nitrogen hydrolase family protein [Bacteroidota bacterium]
MKQSIRVGLAQIHPVWLNRQATIEKVGAYVQKAAAAGCDLVTFGEALVPGYPFWLSITDGARFNDPVQKAIHAHYLDQAVRIEKGDLDPICQLAKAHAIAVILGTIELGQNRGNHSVYCTLVYIDRQGVIQTTHRKLMPTYEERLTWSPGDGHGLRTHPLEAFTVGALNCWENWMPLPRAALYGMGEDLHVAIWPGGYHNTHDLTKFIAKESRSYVISVSGLFHARDIDPSLPHADRMMAGADGWLANGGSCISNPRGEWVIEPLIEKEELLVADLDHQLVREERQNFDPSGHYSRPDVTQLSVNRQRQSVLRIDDGPK